MMRYVVTAWSTLSIYLPSDKQLNMFKKIRKRLKKRLKRTVKQIPQPLTPAQAEGLLGEALASGFFDAEWYQATYNRRFDSVNAAFEDYLHKSVFSPVNPSPAFDSEIYHRLHTDVYTGLISPLAHYLSYGRQEGRHYVPATDKWRPQNVLSPANELAADIHGKKIAVCLHIYYPDFIERFSRALSYFPAKVDVLITASDKVSVEEAKKVFANMANVNEVHVKSVPNRGRNFAPMLVEYSRKLLDYDLFCHLHSKKSLYSGTEQSQWSEYLSEYLLRDTVVTTGMLNLFAENENLGIYYPTSFWMMPSWVNHWTVNKPHCKKWLEQFDMQPETDFINYPVGSMFWGRPKALKQLLDHDYQYNDFPEEPLPNDGSMLHALERMIGLLAEKNGYQQFFYYPASGVFTTDTSYRFIQYHNTSKNAFEQFANHQIISFDVFDTLVRRKYHTPDYAKLLLGKMLAEEALVNNAEDFVSLRNQSEFDLRKRAQFKGDIGITSIYLEIGKRLKIPEQRAYELMQQEFEIDLSMLEARDEMVSIFNELHRIGRELWIISDTYYNEEHISLILKKAGITAPYRLLISSEQKKRKDNTTMWQFVKDELKKLGNPGFLHIGDNVVSDAQLPGDFGIRNYHILNPMDKWHALGFTHINITESPMKEKNILKWGPLVYNTGRSPFIGE